MRQFYRVIIFFSDGGEPIKYRHVANVSNLLSWVEENLQGGQTWKYANVYDKATGQYLRRVYPRK